MGMEQWWNDEQQGKTQAIQCEFVKVKLSISLRISFALSPLAHQKKKKMHKRTLLFGIISLKHGRHFDYRYQPLNMRIRVCYLVIHIENLLRPLQLLYFHL
jgi:hypothetical protein